MNVPLASIAAAALVAMAAGYAVTREEAPVDVVAIGQGPGVAELQPGGEQGADPAPAEGEEDLAPPENDQGEAVPIRWQAPATWKEATSASSMRLETRAIPAAAGDPQGAELSVVLAGGGTQANVDRWVGQFEDPTARRQEQRVIAGLAVTIVSVEGTYVGGMGADDQAREAWALLGAIVETPGQSVFFKITGPAATVRAARNDFDSLISSIAPN